MLTSARPGDDMSSLVTMEVAGRSSGILSATIAAATAFLYFLFMLTVGGVQAKVVVLTILLNIC